MPYPTSKEGQGSTANEGVNATTQVSKYGQLVSKSVSQGQLDASIGSGSSNLDPGGKGPAKSKNNPQD